MAAQRRPLTTVWYLTLSNPRDIQRVITKISPFASKKRRDLVVALDYLTDRITGNEAIRELNESIKEKRRSGFIRKVALPYTRSAGILRGRQFGASAGARARLVHVPASLQMAIRKDRALYHLTIVQLQSKYGYSERVTRRIISA